MKANNEQPSLFSQDAYGGFRETPLSRTSDPPTSHEAGERHQRSGKVEGHALIVLGLLKRFPKRTYGEIWALATDAEREELKEPQEIARRTDTLAKAGLAKAGVQRVCTARGTKAREWEAT